MEKKLKELEQELVNQNKDIQEMNAQLIIIEKLIELLNNKVDKIIK